MRRTVVLEGGARWGDGATRAATRLADAVKQSASMPLTYTGVGGADCTSVDWRAR